MIDLFDDAVFEGTYQSKAVVAKTSLIALGVVFELAARYCREVQEEIKTWPEDMTFTMGILPKGPFVTLKREGDRVRYLGSGMQDPDLAILFKNVDAALLMFTGQIGTHTAAAQRRFIVHGSISDSMKVARALGYVQMFLFPGIILKKTAKRPPKLTREQLIIKARILAELTPGLIRNAMK